MEVSLICLAIFLFLLWIASKGLTTLKMIGNIAGTAMFVMSILFIILAVTAPAMTGAQVATPNMTTVSTYIPKFDFTYLTTISMLVFAVGGCEKFRLTSITRKTLPKSFLKE